MGAHGMARSRDEVPGYRLRGMLWEGQDRRLHRAEALGSPGRPLMIEIHDTEVEEAALARLQRQTDALRALEHPGLLPVHDLVTLPTGIALVMPAAVGGSLGDILDAPEDVHLAATTVTSIATAAHAAVAAAHTSGLHHGALSAEQVRFDSGGAPVLLGFGTDALRADEEVGGDLQRKDRADLERLLAACRRTVAGDGAASGHASADGMDRAASGGGKGSGRAEQDAGGGSARGVPFRTPGAGRARVPGNRRRVHDGYAPTRQRRVRPWLRRHQAGGERPGALPAPSADAPATPSGTSQAPPTAAGPVRAWLVLAAAAVLATPVLLVTLAVSSG